MRLFILFLLVSLVLTACGVTPAIVSPTSSRSAGGTIQAPNPTDAPAAPASPTTDNSDEEGDPLSNPRVPSIGEYSFSQLLPYDGIRPVYDPDFVKPQDVENLLQDDELVLGMSLGNEAKAYPISVLRFREMVNDEMAGIPTLVTW
jgi:hypothetical protein